MNSRNLLFDRVALFVHVELAQLELQQAHVQDVAGDAGNLHSISDPDSAFSNQQKIPNAGQNDVLQRDSYAGRLLL